MNQLTANQITTNLYTTYETLFFMFNAQISKHENKEIHIYVVC